MTPIAETTGAAARTIAVVKSFMIALVCCWDELTRWSRLMCRLMRRIDCVVRQSRRANCRRKDAVGMLLFRWKKQELDFEKHF